MKKKTKKKISKSVKKGIMLFEPNVDIEIIKENPDGSFIGITTPIKVENIDTTVPTIKATLKVLGRTYESKGNTPDEVLNGFKTENWIKGAGVLRIEKDGRVREKIIPGSHIRNVFGMASGTLRTVSLKYITSLFL